MRNKFVKPIFAITLLSISLALALNPINLRPGVAFAEEDDCSWLRDGIGRCASVSIKQAFEDIDLRRTTLDLVNTIATELPAYGIASLSADQLSCCISDRAASNAACSPETLAQLNEGGDRCAILDSNPLAVAAGVMEPVKLSGAASGSLMGVLVNTQEMTIANKFPTNLAYYGRHVLRKIPILGNTAYAQKVDTSNLFGVSLVLSLWEITRSLAFGLMAVFMLIIGVMIMMRKSIDPRTAVTVQNALPRIVISLILITFSYAIGALMIALINPLNSVALEPLRLIDPPFGLLWLFLALVWASTGGGAVSFIAIILYFGAVLVLIIELAIITFKTIIAYVKLLILLVIAPLQFAWGAIPGNEDSITNWFKAALVNVMAIPAMTAVLSFGLYFGYKYLADATAAAYSSKTLDVTSGLFGEWANITTLLVPIAMAVIFMQASSLPKKIEEAVMGKKRR